MSIHLTSSQIEDYQQRRLAPRELLDAGDHLAGCAACRRSLESALSPVAAEMAIYADLAPDFEVDAGAPAHLSFEQSAAYVDGLFGGDERRTVQDHLASCASCAMEVEDLRAFRNTIAPELDREFRPKQAVPPSSWRDRFAAAPFFKLPVWAYASALLLLAAAAWVVWRSASRPPSPQIAVASPTPAPASTPPMRETAPALAQLNDGGSLLMLDAQGKLSGADHLPPAYQRLVEQALKEQRVEKSPLLASLSRGGGALMGADEQGNRFALREPIGKVLLSDRPTLRWSSLQGAGSYTVEIYDARFNPVAKSPSLKETAWTPPPLKPGEVYSWQVKAIKDGRDVLAPRPDAPQAKFRILDRTTAAEIARARRDYAGSHLLLGLLYARAGLLEDADREFRALQSANPDEPNADLIRKLTASASASRR